MYIYIYIYTLQTSHCTHLLYQFVLQAVLGIGVGMNVTAKLRRPVFWAGASLSFHLVF